MTQIFLNYRSDDEPYGVRLLDRELSARFGDDVVFLASKSIELGDDWERRMFDAIDESAAVLVVIGRNWLDAKDKSGLRWWADPDDFVPREIRVPLDRGKKVVPVRLDVPRLRADQLPAELRDLAGRQDIVIGFRKAKVDIDELATKLRRQIPSLREAAPADRQKPAETGRKSVIRAKNVGTVVEGDVHAQTFNAGSTFH